MLSRNWLQDVSALIARVGIGLIWVSHGWPKIQNPGEVATEFAQLGVYLPTVSAWFAAIVEFVVAIAFIVGIGLPFAGILLVLDAAGVIYFSVGITGFIHLEGDSQLVFVLAMGSLIAAFHGGRYSIDQRFNLFRPSRAKVGTAA
ncbi:MAG TPA: DoxX family protein [Pseudonocardia sp.]|nr:DoxX family protein [Pseudonocardia sp.]